MRDRAVDGDAHTRQVPWRTMAQSADWALSSRKAVMTGVWSREKGNNGQGVVSAYVDIRALLVTANQTHRL